MGGLFLFLSQIKQICACFSKLRLLAVCHVRQRRFQRSPRGSASAASLRRIAAIYRRFPSLPVSLVYPYARFYPARLRFFVEAMRAAAPEVVGEHERDRAPGGAPPVS